MKKIKRPLIIFVIVVLAAAALIIIFISPISKYLIEKYSEKYTNRKITVGWAYVNPFTGYVHLDNLKIHEFKSDSLFLSADGLSVKFGLLKLFRHTFEIQSLTLSHPVIKVIRDHEKMNFDDVIDKFSSKDTTKKKDTTSSHVNLLDLRVEDAEIHYTDKSIPVDYFIKKGNFDTKGMYWNEDSMAIHYSFLSGPTKGSMRGEFDMNFKTSDYLIADQIGQFDLKPLEQYVSALVNYGTIEANLDADLSARGNFHNAKNLIAKGTLAINDFHFGKKKGDDYMSFEKLKIDFDDISPVNQKYFFHTISLLHPYFKYEQYDKTNNLQTMFAKKGATSSAGNAPSAKINILVAIGQYVKELASDFFRSAYKVDNLSIRNADARYNDYSLSEEFSSGLEGLDITADSINKKHSRVNIFVKSGLRPYGNLGIDLSIDPNDSSYFDLDFHIRNVPATLFNPYLISYTSYPLDRGTIEFNGSWHVLGGSINSENHLLIVDPRATKRIRGKDKKWIPMPLIFAFIRERGDVIDYQIPITGNMKNPKFHFHDVVKHLLENIFVKPATTPYRFEVKNTEQAVEKLLVIKWPLMSSNLLPSQDKFLTQTADFLAKNKSAQLDIQRYEYTSKEKEYLTLFEAKKKYFLNANHKDAASFTAADSLAVYKMSVRDGNFMSYLNRQVKDSLLFTLQDKCKRLVGVEKINNQLARLEKVRMETFIGFFKKQNVADRVKFYAEKTVIPYDGFSYFRIGYQGEVPEDLVKAYQKMSQLNEEAPRKKYLKEHKKTLQ